MAMKEQTPQKRRRALAAGALGVLFVLLLVWTQTPAEPTPGPPVLPQPAAMRAPAATPVPRDAADQPASPAEPELKAETPPDETDAAGDREEVLSTCERIAAKLGSVSLEDCTENRLQPSGARSTLGTPILVAEFPPLPEREPLGRVLLFGGIHGDELSSVSIVYAWLATLDRYHSGLFHWRVAPLVNPDGLLRERSQRMNDRGVDLNRNFPSPNWRIEAQDYWVRRTRWLHEQIETFRPAAIVAVHAPSHVVDYDGPPEPPERLGPLLLKQMGTYPGSLGRFAGIHLGLPVVTIELPSAGIMPTKADQRRMWVDLVAWLKRNVPNRTPPRVAQIESPEPAPAATMER
jgi:hypothetical protein